MTKITSFFITILCRRVVLTLMTFACFMALSSSSLFAQNVQHTANKPDLGLRSDTRVDPSTLGMSFSIPLASYPGRAGNDFPVAITYSSKVLRLGFRGVDSPPISGTVTWTGLEFAEHSTAGWTSTLDVPRVEFTGMGQFYDWQGRAACEDVCIPGQTTPGDHYVKRIHVHMPDGSTHELRLDDQAHAGLPVAPFTGTFHAVDGSRMRFESSTGTSVLHLPDGSRYLFGSYDIGKELAATHFIDRHGNTLAYNATNRQWTDTLGRVITNPLPANPAANTETYFQAKQVGGTDVTYTLRWKNLADVLTPDPSTGLPPPLHYPGNYKCAPNSYQNVSPSLFTSPSDTKVCVEQDQFGNPVLFNPVVLAELVLPTGKVYRFTYNVYGEIDKILLTTGATERFTYGQVGTLSASTSPYNQTNRGVMTRRVSATGATANESVWTYAVTSTNPYVVRSTSPDASYSERLLHRSRYSGSGTFAQFGFDDARMGMAYEERVYNSSGVMLRRQLSKWVEAGPTAGGVSTAARDPKVTKQVSIILDGAGSNALTATTVNRYEQASQPLNLTSTTQYSFDSSTSKTTAQTALVDSFNPPDALAVRTTETAYLDDAAYFARGLVSLPVSLTVRSGMPGGTQRARAETSYDQLDSNHALLPCGATAGWGDPGTTIRGNATTTGAWLNTTGVFLQAHTQYDQCGNVRKTWDARDTTFSNPAQIEYSSSYQFAYATLATSPDPDGSGPLTSHTTSTEYDFSTGLVTATIDANAQRTTFAYNDPLNRLKQVIHGATDDAVKTQTIYEYDDTNRTVTVKSDLHEFDDKVLKTESVYDGLGRTIETRQYEGGDSFIAVQTQYDAMGRPFKTSNPFRPQSQSAAWTTQLFDALGRVTSVMTPDNAVVSTSYSGNSVTVTDQTGKARKSVTDALGRMVEVYEDPNGVNYQTTYLYDVLDNLAKVTQGSQQRFFMYDSLKRLIRTRNPEQSTHSSLNLSDPITSNSAWSFGYEYDANGNLTQKTDPRGVVSTYVYDALNRNTNVNYSDATLDVGRQYDLAINGKGRISQVWQSGATTSATYIDSYDALGRPLVQRQRFETGAVWSSSYQVSREYNRAGGVESQTYPSGRAVTYNYDPAGRVADKDVSHVAFKGNLGDGVERTYATGINYSQWGGVSREKYGTNTAVYNKLHYNIRGQLCDVRASNVDEEWSGELGALVNHYSTQWVHCGSGTDNNGNVLMSQTIVNSYFMEDRYSYDSLNRLSAVDEWQNGATQTGSQQYDYDRWGNRTIKSASWGTGINTRQFTVDAATNRLGVPAGQSGVMTYDFAGNLTNDTYTGAGLREYDAENRMTQAWGGNNQWQYYAYNADGQRVRRKIDNQETWQIYGFDGELLAEYAANGPQSSPQKEYGYRNGQLLITAEGGTTESPSGVNVASASSGAVATASSIFGGTAPGNANNGDHVGTGSWWADDTSLGYPDWLQVEFAGAKTISEINVFGLQQNYSSPVEPTMTMTSSYALTNFEVQYWTGSAWATIPGGSVTGNDKVWRKFTFAPLSTTKIRVHVTHVAGDNRSQVVEVEAYGPQNVASASSGAVATASSTYAGITPANANNGDHVGTGSWWADSTSLGYPDWLQVEFAGAKTISEINVFGLQQNYSSPVEPTLTMTSSYALTNFEVQYWTGSAWATIPGGSVTGNDKVWRKFTFAPLSTTKIRVHVTHVAGDNHSQVVEIEAYGASSPSSLRWLVADHLGTPRMLIDQTGTLANIKRHDYLPFGEELFAPAGGRSSTNGYSGGDGVRQQFTQKERDIETGLDYLINRYYSSTQGRFISVDPDNAGSYSGNPQTWNGYSYALNQPTLYSDPDGLTVRICGTDGQCTDKDTHLTDAEFEQRFRRRKGIQLRDGKIFQNGEQIGTFRRLSCDECLYDIHAIARGVEAADPGRRAVQVWGASVVAGLSLPSSGAGYVFVGVFTVLVPPPGESTGGEIALTTRTDRQAAVRDAWKLEAERARSGKPTNTPFTANELRELRDTGKVSGYEGHHVESVSNNPGAARDPKNIKFVRGRAAHLAEHGGNFRNRTPLKPR